ncbi:MAG: LamG-like jellyroll fold domain-containing protein [Bacteroidota bacterium]
MKKKYSFLVLIVLFGLAINPVPVSSQSCDNLVSYWRMEENGGNTFTDIIGGHDAMGVTSSPVRDAGKVGKAQSFNGTSDFLQISDHTDFDWSGTQDFSLEMWVKLKSISSVDNMIFLGRDEFPGSIHWWLGAEKNTGRVVFNLIDSEGTNNISYGPNLAIGTWYHLVVVRNAATGTTLFYVNNTEVDNDVVNYSSGSFGTDAPIDLGFLSYNNVMTRFFAPAVIDEVAIYNSALSADDIDIHYNNGVFGIGYCEDYNPYFLSIPDTLGVVGETFTYEAYATGLPTLAYNLVSGPGSINPTTGVLTWTPTSVFESGASFIISATNSQGTVNQSFKVYLADAPSCPAGVQNMYKFDDSGNPYKDFMGNNDGEALNTPTPVSGKFNGALQFDGVDDGMNLPDNDSYDFRKDASFSFEFWLKTAGSESNMVCMGRQGTFTDTDTSDLHMWVGVVKNTGNVAFYLRDAKGNEPSPNGQIQGGDVSDNNWHYVVAVRDGVSHKNYLYVDGSEVAVSETFTYSNSFGTFPGDPFNIGFLSRPNGNPDYFFNGTMDEVAIYTKALSATEVSNNFLKSFAGDWHCEPGNYAPLFVSDPVEDAMEAEPYTYDIVTNDIDEGDLLTLSVPTKPDWLTFTDQGAGKGNLSGTPGNADVGPQVVVITVSDGKTPINQEFTIDVVNKNDPPEITSTPVLTVDEDALYSYTVVATDPDINDVLSYTATTIPAWLTLDPTTHELSGTPLNGDVGDHDVVIVVSDGLVDVEDVFTITVSNVNDVPVISGQRDLATDEDNGFILAITDLTVIDEDNDPSELTLVVENGINYTFAGTVITPAENFNGLLIVNVHVDDPESSSNSYALEVTVNPVNDAPVVTEEAEKTATIDKLYGYVFAATDPDGDQIIKSAASIPAFLDFDPNSGILGGTPRESDAGWHDIALQVSDGALVTTYEYALHVWWPTGIEQDASLIERVYPNPANEKLTFEFDVDEQGTIAVIDLSGKQLITKEFAASDKMIQIDVSKLEEGQYMYKFQSGDQVSIHSFIVSR